ncbi:transporter [Armatimonas sp.]|uniref:transporter n=1 Tax=Armatimonas sp. TaxID=1872638 RepID=UPI003752ECB0
MRKTTVVVGALTTITLWGSLAQAQESPPAKSPIVTDRPDFTESNQLVMRGALQLESGFTLTNQRGGGRTAGLPELLLRYGASSGVEWRVGVPGFERVTANGVPALSGFGDTYLGLKLPLPALKNGTELALIPAFFIPSGKAGIESEATQPEVKLVWAHGLARERSLSGMLYVSVPQEEGKRQQRLQHTVSYGLPLGKGTGMFMEAVTDIGQGVAAAHQLHSGVTFQPNATSQWDIHFGMGLNRQAPHGFIAAGYSVRFGGSQ